MTAFSDVGLVYHGLLPTSDNGVGRMASYEDLDPRVTFMSVFPVSSQEGLGANSVRTACQIRRCLYVLWYHSMYHTLTVMTIQQRPMYTFCMFLRR